MYKSLLSIPESDVTMESTGYVLVKVSDPEGNSKTVVVGMSDYQDEFDKFKKKLPLGYACAVLGGGEVHPSKHSWGTLELMGKHAIYGAADHKIAAEIILRTTPYRVHID